MGTLCPEIAVREGTRLEPVVGPIKAGRGGRRQHHLDVEGNEFGGKFGIGA